MPLIEGLLEALVRYNVPPVQAKGTVVWLLMILRKGVKSGVSNRREQIRRHYRSKGWWCLETVNALHL